MLPDRLEAAREIAERHSGLAFLLAFGSRARGDAAASSDWEFGFLATGPLEIEGLRAELSLALGTDRVDLVDLARASRLACNSTDWHRIEQRLLAAAKTIGFERAAGPPREGPALLQGRVVCGLCGSRMHVHYNTRRSGELVTNYVCAGRTRLFGDPLCQSVLGTAIDAAVGQLLVEAVTPLALELSLAVQAEISARHDEADRLRRQVERAHYEVDRATCRWTPPTGSSPTRWKPTGMQSCATWPRLKKATNARERPIGSASTKESATASWPWPQIYQSVWRDPKTPQRERKRMLALLIEDVTLIKQREITATVRFRGGASTTLTLPRPLTAQQIRATHAEVRQAIDTLLDEYTDAQVAHILNERGLCTGAGGVFDRSGVQWVRFSAKLKNLKERLPAGLRHLRHRPDHARPLARKRSHQGSHLQRPG